MPRIANEYRASQYLVDVLATSAVYVYPMVKAGLMGKYFTLQMHIIDKEKTRGLFLADTFAITASGPKCLNKLAPQLIRV